MNRDFFSPTFLNLLVFLRKNVPIFLLMSTVTPLFSNLLAQDIQPTTVDCGKCGRVPYPHHCPYARGIYNPPPTRDNEEESRNAAKTKLDELKKLQRLVPAITKPIRKNVNKTFAQLLQDPNGQGIPIDAPRKGEPKRSTYNYAKVIDQFQVGVSARYARNKSNTYCNIFSWDVTRAMGAELPHFINENDPSHSSAINEKGNFVIPKKRAKELSINETIEWLKKYGKNHGWKKISVPEAQRIANEGHPTIAVWENINGPHGHIAVVRPGSDGDSRETAIAQSGSLVENATHLRKGFNDEKKHVKSIQYWYHE